MADGDVQLAPDSTGKYVDTFEITRTSDGKVVERQKFVLVDPADPGSNGAAVNSAAPTPTDVALRTRGYASIEDVCVYLKAILTAIAHPQNVNPGTGQTRTEIDSIATGVTMPVSGTVNVGTMTSMSQLGGVSVAPTLVVSQMNSAWAQAVRSRIS